MSDSVLFQDEEKAGPASTAVAEQAVVSAKKEEEFRNYKNSKRQAVTSTLQHSTAPSLTERGGSQRAAHPLSYFCCCAAALLVMVDGGGVLSTAARESNLRLRLRDGEEVTHPTQTQHEPTHLCCSTPTTAPVHSSTPPSFVPAAALMQIPVTESLRDVHLGLLALPGQTHR